MWTLVAAFARHDTLYPIRPSSGAPGDAVSPLHKLQQAIEREVAVVLGGLAAIGALCAPMLKAPETDVMRMSVMTDMVIVHF